MDARQVAKELAGPGRSLRAAIPEVYAGFTALNQAAMEDGALDRKTKELIALAIAVSRQCDGCISSHARGAAKAGASSAEVADMLGVCLMMGGGPGTVYAPRAWEAFHQFAEPTPDA